MAVPYTFGTATAAIPLSQLDSNFATAITLGNTAVYLGNTTTSIGNLTLTNVTISSGEVTTGNVSVSGNVTLSGGTANGVAYLNGSKVLTTGSALTYDGTNLTVNTGTVSATYGKLTVAGGISITPDSSSKFQIGRYSAGAPYSYIKMGSTSSGLKFTDPADSVDLMTLDSSGNLGLGVTPNPLWGSSSAIDITAWTAIGTIPGNGSTVVTNNAYYNSSGIPKYKIASFNAAAYSQSIGGVHSWSTAGTGSKDATITFTQAMTLDASGNLGVGTSSPALKFVVSNGGAAGVEVSPTGGNQGGAYFQSYNRSGAAFVPTEIIASKIGFYTGSSPAFAALIDSSGNLLVGRTSVGQGGTTGVSIEATSPNGGGNVWIANSGTTSSQNPITVYSTGASAYRFYLGMQGQVYATNTTITAISDQRLKENIVDLDVGLDSIMALKPRKFDWKEGKGKDIKGDRGFIAQEFETVFPDMIEQWLDPAPEGEEPYKAVNANLIPILVKAIQEQQAIIQSLTARITALESA